MIERPGPLPTGQDRAGLVATVRAGLASVPTDATVVVALSGGPDSTALAYLATEARPDLAVTLAHVRHGLRDDHEDLAVATRHATYLGLPLEVREVTVQPGEGPQAAARSARYAALREVATATGSDAILVGHTADDQAETLLLRLARGTGVAGLAGMRTVAGDLVRPMLRLRRADVRRFVVLEGLPTAADPSNQDVEVPRVAVRELGLPLLGRFGPDPVGALGRLATLAADDEAALASWAERLVAAAAVDVGPTVAVPDAALAAVPVAVVRRVWRQLVHQVTGGPPPSAATVARITSLRPGQRAVLPGPLHASAGGGWRALAPDQLPTASPREVMVPGTTSWPPAGLVIRAVTAGSGDQEHAPVGPPERQIALPLRGAWTPVVPSPDLAAVPPGGDRDRIHLAVPGGLGPLRVRHRRPGDRVATRVGHQKVADILVDAGVPRPVRALWPVVTAGERVVWVPGLAADASVLAAGRSDPETLLVLAAR